MSQYYSRDELDDDEILIPKQRSRIVKGVKSLRTPKTPTSAAKFNFGGTPRARSPPRKESRGRSMSRARSTTNRGRSMSRARSTTRDENHAGNAADPVRRGRSMSRPRRQHVLSPPNMSRIKHKTIKSKKKGSRTVISKVPSSDSSSSSSDDSDSHHRSHLARNSRNSRNSQRNGPAEDFGTLGEQFVHLLQKNFSQACTTGDLAPPSKSKKKSSKMKEKHRLSKELRQHIIAQSSSSSSSSDSSDEESEDETRLDDLIQSNLMIRRRLSQTAKSRSDTSMESKESRWNRQFDRGYDKEERTDITEYIAPQPSRSQRNFVPPLGANPSGESRQQQHLRYASNSRQRGGILIDDEDGVFRPNQASSSNFCDFDERQFHQQAPSRCPPNERYHRPPPPRSRPAPSVNPSFHQWKMLAPFDDHTIETRPTHELSEYSITLEQQASKGLPSGMHSMNSGSFGGLPQRRMPLVEHHSYDGIGRIPSISSNNHLRPHSSLPDMHRRRGNGVERAMPPLQQRRYERIAEANSCVSSASHFQSRKMLVLPVPPGTVDFVLVDTPNGTKVSWAGFASNLKVGDYVVGVENKDTRGLNAMVVTKLLNTKKRKSRIVTVRRIESDEI